MTSFALYNIKGGVGKTAAAVNLAYLSALEGRRTLLIDLDPQSAAGYYYRIRADQTVSSKAIVKGGNRIQALIKETDFEGLYLLPGRLSYRNLDLKLNAANKSKKRIGNLLHALQGDYDIIFIDAPPNITLLSENILRGVDFVLTPVIPTYLSMRTLEELYGFFHKKQLHVSKIIAFFSMAEKRKKAHREIMENDMNRSFNLIEPFIPYAAEVEDMGRHRMPLPAYRKKSLAVQAFYELWNDIKRFTVED